MNWPVFGLICALAFGSYYSGILIRFYGLPGANSLPLKRQLLLGVPVSIGVVTPLVTILAAALRGSQQDPVSLLGVLGIIMEHGMVFNETLTKRLHDLVEEQKD